MERRLSIIDSIILVTIALFFDLLSIIPFLNIITSAISTFSFQVYFYLKGVKKAQYSLIGNLVEFIPILSILPAVTLGVVVTIVIDRNREKIEHQLSQQKKKKEEAAQTAARAKQQMLAEIDKSKAEVFQ